MREYHKINTIYKRDERTKKIVEGDWSTPEFAYLADAVWEWTEKVDGTNVRVMWDGANVTFGGKTDNAQIPVKLLYSLQAYFEGTAKKALLADVFGTDGGVCLYGEGYGQSIQKVGAMYKPDGTDFVLFDVRVGDWWLERADVVDVATKLSLPVVPVVGAGTLLEAAARCRTLLSTWGNFEAEGLVMRPKVSLLTRAGQRIIAKIKARDFK
jgi:ATP-dependent RNA circularization protein (DNA/RNA ligase family)